MLTLTVDVGNSRTKYELWRGNHWVDSIEREDLNDEGLKVEGIIIASVKKEGEKIEEVDNLQKRNGCPFVVFNSEEIAHYNDRNLYKGNVGADRFAAYLGVMRLRKPDQASLIVDAGTALTIDVCNSEGQFCGGNISLGLTSRLKALHYGTSLLPEVKIEGETPAFGTDTVTAIEAGAINGVVGEINLTIELARKIYGIKKVWFTGGDFPLFEDYLDDSQIEMEYDPQLVGRGLNRHLRTYYLRKR